MAVIDSLADAAPRAEVARPVAITNNDVVGSRNEVQDD
jgi:hypothetical protein